MTRVIGTVTGVGRRTLLATALAVAGFAGAAQAQGAGDLVTFTVIDRETGQPLQVYRHNGRAYVAGQPGARYGLRISNNSGERVLVAPSVDGVNVLTGQTAGHGQRGYVFDAYQTYDVSGWRKSDSEIAAFTFAPLSKSYAARTGRPNDVGVIGIAVFKERYVPPAPPPPPLAAVESRSAPGDGLDELVVTGSRAAPSASPSAVARARPQEKLGTGHGAREWSVVTTVAFERATSYPQLIRQIEYDTYDNLAALGVIRRPPSPGPRPRPFPSSGYVPDPPGMP